MKKTFLTLLLTLTLSAISQLASADGWPPSVVGTWNVKANTGIGTLNITSQQATGQCRQISGNIFGDPIQGFYCPFSGRIHFVRKQAATNDTTQVYSANLSQKIAAPLFMGGSFSSLGSAFGEYAFTATK